MSNLTFNSTELTPVNQNDNQIWLKSADLAKALGYKRADQVNKIFSANADEFTSSMTLNANLALSNKNNELQTVKARIFSLRGCHLIAMFSRTKVAKEFRKWVLDVLDKEVGEPIQIINDVQQRMIQKAVSRKSFKDDIHHATIYNQLKDKFGVPKYNRLPFANFDDCMEWLDPLYVRATEKKPVSNIDNAQLYKICHDFINIGVQHLTLVHNLNISMYSNNDSQLRDIAQRVKGAIDFSKQNNLISRNGSPMMQKDRITCFNGSRESYGDDKMAMIEYFTK